MQITLKKYLNRTREVVPPDSFDRSTTYLANIIQFRTWIFFSLLLLTWVFSSKGLTFWRDGWSSTDGRSGALDLSCVIWHHFARGTVACSDPRCFHRIPELHARRRAPELDLSAKQEASRVICVVRSSLGELIVSEGGNHHFFFLRAGTTPLPNASWHRQRKAWRWITLTGDVSLIIT